MRATAVLIGVAAAVATLASAQSSCRPEWNDLSDADRQNFIDAILALRNRTNSCIADSCGTPDKMSYSDFIYLHVKESFYIHFTALFFPWHRAFVNLFEQAIQSTGKYSLGIPYWDWTQDNQNSYNQLTSAFKYFGSTGTKNIPNSYCVTDGQLTWDKPPDFSVQFGNTIGGRVAMYKFNFGDSTCFRRKVTGSCSPIGDLTQQTGVITFLNLNPDLQSLTDNKDGPHAACHLATGGTDPADIGSGVPFNPIGDMADLSYSPLDAVFWLHHGMVDKMWWMWQNQCPSWRGQNDLSNRGINYPNHGLHDVVGPAGTPLPGTHQIAESIDEALIGLSDLTVRKVLDVKGVCYAKSYIDTNMQFQPVINCPDNAKPTSSVATASSTAVMSSSPAATSAAAVSQPREDVWLSDLLQQLNPEGVAQLTPTGPRRFGGPGLAQQRRSYDKCTDSKSHHGPSHYVMDDECNHVAPVDQPVGHFTCRTNITGPYIASGCKLIIPPGQKLLYADNFLIKTVPIGLPCNQETGRYIGRVHGTVVHAKRVFHNTPKKNPNHKAPHELKSPCKKYQQYIPKEWAEMNQMDWSKIENYNWIQRSGVDAYNNDPELCPQP